MYVYVVQKAINLFEKENKREYEAVGPRSMTASSIINGLCFAAQTPCLTLNCSCMKGDFLWDKVFRM